MSVLATQPRRGRARGSDCEHRVLALWGQADGEPTLDELVSETWVGLVAHQVVPCPVCGGDLAASEGAHARPTEGRCGDCGTTLS